MTETTIKTLYVFVEIAIDSHHLVQTIRLNFPTDKRRFHETLLDSEEENSQIPAGRSIGPGQHLRIEGAERSQADDDSEVSNPSQGSVSSTSEPTRLALVSTIQFVAALARLKDDLTTELPNTRTDKLLEGAEGPGGEMDVDRPRLQTGKYEATIPRSKPLSPGEILGCTAPHLNEDVDALMYALFCSCFVIPHLTMMHRYLGDGRFHLESIMIANPSVPAFRYDPYSKKLTRERYNHSEMRTVRHEAVQTARRSIDALASSSSASENAVARPAGQEPPLWGVVLGTLGRQGSFKQLQAITHQLSSSRTPIPYMPILLSELSPAKLSLFSPHISTFVQTSCPRLSIDWGYAFEKPLLSPYETAVAVGKAVGWIEEEDDGRRRENIYPMDFYAAGTPWTIARSKAVY